MKKEITITIDLTDDIITLEGEDIPELIENDIIDSVKLLTSLLQIGDFTNGNA